MKTFLFAMVACGAALIAPAEARSSMSFGMSYSVQSCPRPCYCQPVYQCPCCGGAVDMGPYYAYPTCRQEFYVVQHYGRCRPQRRHCRPSSRARAHRSMMFGLLGGL